jgi:MFS superfamily sulfate permease-like transporter
MKKINRKIVFNLLFNIAETLLIFLIGKSLNLPINHIIMVMLTFMISRGYFGKSLHFKSWYRCLVWSAIIMLSLFLILKVDLVLSILFAVFSAFIMTGKSNINDMYLWNNNNEPSKYQDVIDYIKYNEFDSTLIEFENKLKDKTPEYLVYKYRFKDNKTFAEISQLLDMDTPRIVEYLDKIAFAIRIYCKF